MTESGLRQNRGKLSGLPVINYGKSKYKWDRQILNENLPKDALVPFPRLFLG